MFTISKYISIALYSIFLSQNPRDVFRFPEWIFVLLDKVE